MPTSPPRLAYAGCFYIYVKKSLLWIFYYFGGGAGGTGGLLKLRKKTPCEFARIGRSADWIHRMALAEAGEDFGEEDVFGSVDDDKGASDDYNSYYASSDDDQPQLPGDFSTASEVDGDEEEYARRARGEESDSTPGDENENSYPQMTPLAKPQPPPPLLASRAYRRERVDGFTENGGASNSPPFIPIPSPSTKPSALRFQSASMTAPGRNMEIGSLPAHAFGFKPVNVADKEPEKPADASEDQDNPSLLVAKAEEQAEKELLNKLLQNGRALDVSRLESLQRRKFVPPHELLAEQSFLLSSWHEQRGEWSSSSVIEGMGRTLKGKDATRVRNEILRKTGFIEKD